MPIRSTVKIIPEKKYPFSILSVKAKNGAHILYSLHKIKGKKKGYLLYVRNILKKAGFYRDSIILKTDSKIQPEIPIMVYARIIDPGAPGVKAANSRENPFLKLIKKMQKQKALKQGKMPSVSRHSVKDEELKKKFEELIKQARQKKKE